MASSAQGVRYLAEIEGRSLGEIRLPVPGRHMGLNSASAVLAAYLLELPITAAEAALGAFPGVRRRFERKGVADGVLVYDEYAYHPTSMTLALQTLREVAGEGRLIVVFQPYRLYRTRDLQAEIAAALGIADELVLLEVFGPGELRQPGEGSAALLQVVPLPADRKAFVEAWDDVPAEVARRARPGDVVVTMGAPPISLMGDQLLDALLARTGDAAAIGTGVDPDGAAATAG
jgi:UDP-N-acetylmuramate--alanine ligase